MKVKLKMKLNGGDYEKGIKISERGFSNCTVESPARNIDYSAFNQSAILLRLLIVGD